MAGNAFPAFQIGKGIADVSIAAAQGDEYAQGSLAGQIVTILVTRKAGSFVAESNILKGGSTFVEYRNSYWTGKVKPFLKPLQNEVTGQIWKQYTELHHHFIPQRASWAPNWLKNNSYNLKEMNSLEHSIVDPYRARFAPSWAKELYNLKWK